jgi:hypothetical protein
MVLILPLGFELLLEPQLQEDEIQVQGNGPDGVDFGLRHHETGGPRPACETYFEGFLLGKPLPGKRLLRQRC